MDKELNNQLKQILKGHRPRPLMYIGWHNGKKCYIRKRDLTYWQLRAKYPLKTLDILEQKVFHPFQKAHHLKRNYWWENYGGYVMAGSAIAFAALIATFYIIITIGVLS